MPRTQSTPASNVQTLAASGWESMCSQAVGGRVVMAERCENTRLPVKQTVEFHERPSDQEEGAAFSRTAPGNARGCCCRKLAPLRIHSTRERAAQQPCPRRAMLDNAVVQADCQLAHGATAMSSLASDRKESSSARSSAVGLMRRPRGRSGGLSRAPSERLGAPQRLGRGCRASRRCRWVGWRRCVPR
jgi:hypothetical protein